MDKKPVLAVVFILGLVTIGGLAGAVVLTCLDKNVPDGVWTTTATAVGAVAAVLTSTRYANGGDAQVGQLIIPEKPIVPSPADGPTGASAAQLAATLPPSALGDQPAVDAGPMDANAIKGYETGPPDQPSAEKLAVDTMGVPPAEG